MTIRQTVMRAAGRVVLVWAAIAVMVGAPELLLAQGKGKAKGSEKKEAAAAAATQAQNANAVMPQQVDCAVYEMAASSGKPNVDPTLRPLQKKLKKPPFSSW